MGSSESKDKPLYHLLFFKRCTSGFTLVDKESSTTIDQKIAMCAFFHANYYLYEALDRTVGTYTAPPSQPGGPLNHQITIDILEYKMKKREICRSLIEKCVNSYIANGETGLNTILKQHLEMFRRLKRTYNTRINYRWNGHMYVHTISVCSFIYDWIRKQYGDDHKYIDVSKRHTYYTSSIPNIRYRDPSLMYAYARE